MVICLVSPVIIWCKGRFACRASGRDGSLTRHGVVGTKKAIRGGSTQLAHGRILYPAVGQEDGCGRLFKGTTSIGELVDAQMPHPMLGRPKASWSC